MLRRYKITKTPDAVGNALTAIQKGIDIWVKKVYLTLPAVLLNITRDVTLERPDGTVLGTEKAVYRTSAGIGLVFTDEFLLPRIEPNLKINTRSIVVTARGDITIEAVYEELE